MKHHHSHIALLMVALSITIFIFALYGYMHYAVGVSLDRALVAREAVKNEQVYKNQRQGLTSLYNDTIKDRAALPLLFVADLAASPVGTRGRISIRVDAVGSWASIMRVLKMAETLPYKTSVSGVRVDLSGDSPDAKEVKREWRVTFVLDTASIRRVI